jgi:hypothetical protein
LSGITWRCIVIGVAIRGYIILIRLIHLLSILIDHFLELAFISWVSRLLLFLVLFSEFFSSFEILQCLTLSRTCLSALDIMDLKTSWVTNHWGIKFIVSKWSTVNDLTNYSTRDASRPRIFRFLTTSFYFRSQPFWTNA